MDPMEASKETECPDERHDLCDDHLQQPAPAPQDNLADQLTSDIQKDPPKAKRPRSKAQQEAFAKAQRALKEKRAQRAKQSPVKSKSKSKAKSEAKLSCKCGHGRIIPHTHQRICLELLSGLIQIRHCCNSKGIDREDRFRRHRRLK